MSSSEPGDLKDANKNVRKGSRAFGGANEKENGREIEKENEDDVDGNCGKWRVKGPFASGVTAKNSDSCEKINGNSDRSLNIREDISKSKASMGSNLKS